MDKLLDSLFTSVLHSLWNVLVDISNMSDLQRKKYFKTAKTENVVKLKLSTILTGVMMYQKDTALSMIDEIKSIKEVLDKIPIEKQSEFIDYVEKLVEETSSTVYGMNGKIY